MNAIHTTMMNDTDLCLACHTQYLFYARQVASALESFTNTCLSIVNNKT